MKDLYNILGVDKTATQEIIKKEYRKLAMKCHADRGGSTERMKELNEAYEVLSNPEKRTKYDIAFKEFNENDFDKEIKVKICGYIGAGNILPFSQEFKDQHNRLSAEFKAKPLQKELSKNYLTDIKPVVSLSDRKIDNLFLYIKQKSHDEKKSDAPNLNKPLDKIHAITIFKDFLRGNYYGSGLNNLKQYLFNHISKLKKADPLARENLLYAAIHEIVLAADKSKDEQKNLIFSFKKISDYASRAADGDLPFILPLFYNTHYRNLFTYALYLFWSSNEDLVGLEKSVKGEMKETAEHLKEWRSRLANHEDNENIVSTVRFIKQLYLLEKKLTESKESLITASDYRNMAFHILDWIPVFRGQAENKIMINIFLQVGIHFQLASLLEKNNTLKMADERLAFNIYMLCVSLSDRGTPNVVTCTNVIILKYLSAFQFQHDHLKDWLPEIQKHTLLITDVFPFYEGRQSNIALFKKEENLIKLMRQLLHTLVRRIEEDQKNSKENRISHTSSTIYYQAYEACLKNWYQPKKHDPVLENQIRLKLMHELLAEQKKNFPDVEKNLVSPYIMVDRTKEGWLNPARSLSFSADSKLQLFRSISGYEVNHTTGTLTFFLDPWSNKFPVYQKAFDSLDFFQIVSKKLRAAFFSLDPVGPEKPYHPFNTMRFGPDQLADSELLNTMFLTDYLLKFFTTRQEVQGRYPFNQRSIEQLIQHLPAHLQEILNNFHTGSHSEQIHRFWIEADDSNIFVHEEDSKEDIRRIKLDELKMLIKKHRMKRDMNGKLIDVGDEDEGWPIYILTPHQLNELQRGIRIIDGHAMIFVENNDAKNQDIQLIYWENNSPISIHSPREDGSEILVKLYMQERDISGKVKQYSKNAHLIYAITKMMSEQFSVPHRYSPEYIFAQEFTEHYDEFAQYFPEFGRLRELAKITIIVRDLDRVHDLNTEKINALNALLNNSNKPPESKIYESLKQQTEKIRADICSNLNEISGEVNKKALNKKWTTKLIGIRDDLAPFRFRSDSKEVNKICNDKFSEASRDNPRVASYLIRAEIDKHRSDWATQLTNMKQKQVRELLTKSFSTFSLLNIDQLITSFMDGNIDPFVQALVSAEQSKHQNDMHQAYPCSSSRTITSALEGSRAAILQIAKEKTDNELRTIKCKDDLLAAEFKKINFASEEKVDAKSNNCYWVPATIRHDVSNLYSFFVYGGVNLQNRTTYLYQKVLADGSHDKFGISVNPAKRYSAAELAGGHLNIIAQANSRQAILRLERAFHSSPHLPWGPGEKQSQYANIPREPYSPLFGKK